MSSTRTRSKGNGGGGVGGNGVANGLSPTTLSLSLLSAVSGVCIHVAWVNWHTHIGHTSTSSSTSTSTSTSASTSDLSSSLSASSTQDIYDTQQALSTAPNQHAMLPELSLPTQVSRDLGFMEADQMKQLEMLIDVPKELQTLPVTCSVCRMVAFDAFGLGTRFAIELTGDLINSTSLKERLRPTLSQICKRLRNAKLFGVMNRRARALHTQCKTMFSDEAKDGRLLSLIHQTAEFTLTLGTAKNTGGHRNGCWRQVDSICEGICTSSSLEPLSGWAAMVEMVLGHEPLSAGLTSKTSSNAFSNVMAHTLLYFAAAKNDVQATRLVLALGGASPASIQSHDVSGSLLLGFGRALARLMSRPSIEQQLRLLRTLKPGILPEGVGRAAELEAYLRTTKARLALRIDDSINDTALHVCAYSYDYENLIALLVRDGSKIVNTPDSCGRTPLHYAADVTDQLAGLVNVFAEPPENVPSILAQRTKNKSLTMAADYTQSEVSTALEESQYLTVKALVTFGADLNVHSAISGSTPLHLAARSGATSVVELLALHGASLEARNRHGATALMVAASGGHSKTCEVLLQFGARKDARDARGRTALWYATASGSAMAASAVRQIFGREKSQPIVENVYQSVNNSAGGWGNFDAYKSGELFSLDLCDVDRVPAHGVGNITAEDFEMNYLLTGRPLVIAQGANGMDAKLSWTRDKFFAKYGDSAFGVQKLPLWAKAHLKSWMNASNVSLKDYFKELHLQPAESSSKLQKMPLSWTNPRNGTLWAEMTQTLSWPQSLLAPTVRRAGSSNGYYGLFMGPQGSGTSMHYHKAAWNALLFGRKLWVLTPPAITSFKRQKMSAAYFGDLAKINTNVTGDHDWLSEAVLRIRSPTASYSRQLLFVIQREGDVLFVPQGWGHATFNLRESIGVANFFLDEDAVGYRPSKIWHSTRGIRSLQTAIGITSPSDMDLDGHP